MLGSKSYAQTYLSAKRSIIAASLTKTLEGASMPCSRGHKAAVNLDSTTWIQQEKDRFGGRHAEPNRKFEFVFMHPSLSYPLGCSSLGSF